MLKKIPIQKGEGSRLNNQKVHREKILIRQLEVRCQSLHLRIPQANVYKDKVAKIVLSIKTKVLRSLSLNSEENYT